MFFPSKLKKEDTIGIFPSPYFLSAVAPAATEKTIAFFGKPWIQN